MNKLIQLFLGMSIITSCSSKITYPETIKENVVENYFGTEVADPYRWLENDTSAATAQWVKEQNNVTFNYLSKIPFRSQLNERLKSLFNYERYSSPFKHNGQYYFFKNDGLQNQSVLYRHATLDAEPEIILDPNTLSSDGTVALSDVEFSKDGKYMAYSIARSGSDWNEIFIVDMATGKQLPDHIKWSKSSEIAWKGNGFYYSAFDAPEAGKEYSIINEYEKVFYHEIGQDQSSDKIIYEDKIHALRECYAYLSSDEQYLFITITETTTGNSLIMKDLSKPTSDFIELAPGFEKDYTVIDQLNGKLYVLTNWNAAKNRLMEVAPQSPARENWKEIIPESEHVLEDAAIIGSKIIATYMKDATNHIYGFDMSGQKLYEVALPSLGTVNYISGDKDDSEAFYTFTSFTCPPTDYRLDVEKNISTKYHESKLDFNPVEYVSEQVFYTSKDGTKIPMTITYKKGLKKDGKNPLLLYGYGGFNISLNPSFKASRIPFLENGGIYVVANLRGGGEYGETWHLAGTKMKKQNVFDDFIAAAEYLISEKYTSKEHLAIDGGSNGGLLVGACLTQRPDLYAVAIPEVGVLDMLRYHKFTIGWSWASDYGTSEESIEMFEYLKGYSPLHNVKKGTQYPATMIMTGDHDDRVVPAHSFKFAATLQAANETDIPTIIRIDSNAGHGAGKPIGKLIDADCDMWSFVMYNLGMKPVFK